MPVLLDMQAMAVDDEAEFFEKMASEISEALVREGLEPGSADFHEGNPTRTFERFIAHTMETLAGRGLLLLFDEYELMESKIDDGVLRREIITFFAGLLEAPRLVERDRVGLPSSSPGRSTWRGEISRIGGC